MAEPRDPDVTEYNPLDYANLTASLVRELMHRGPYGLPVSRRIAGAGVYALFYQGDFVPYARIKSLDSSQPIYVGKAVPRGARKGRTRGQASTATELYSRLNQHARSIEATGNLRLSDFTCRFLVVTPLWITMAERFLIENFQPVWNVWLEGFGIHDPGSGRHAGEVSWWDALHPGREFALRLRSTRSEADARAWLAEFFRRKASDPESIRRQAREIAESQSPE